MMNKPFMVLKNFKTAVGGMGPQFMLRGLSGLGGSRKNPNVDETMRIVSAEYNEAPAIGTRIGFKRTYTNE